jgi:hypothetical protein
MTRARHTQLHLPALSGQQAFLLANALEQLASAIWRAHRDAMADFQGRAFPDLPPDPDSVTLTDNPHDNDEDDVNF